MIERLRRDDAFGLIELVTALVVLNVAILALFAMFNAGVISIARASHTSTAAVLAEKQMELYRALLYQNIGLDQTLVGAADSTHQTWDPTEWAGGAQVIVAAPDCTPAIDECKPVRTGVVGPDNHTYRIDTYVRSVTPVSGRATKRVTVAVRREGDLVANPLAKLNATFDLSTGCVYGSTTAPC